MDIDISKLRHIVAIARTLSFSRAAEELNITQPALSRSIAGVEQRFGIRIFDRDRSGVSITPVGALVVAEAEALIGSARTLQHNLHLYAKGEAGTLTIGMGPLVASIILPELGSQFLNSTPRLHFVASIKPPVGLLQELMDDKIELAVCAIEHIELPETAVAFPVGEILFESFVRSRHPLAGREGLTASDLDGYPIARIGDAHTTISDHKGGAFICDNYHILRDVVLRSDCVWRTSAVFAAPQIAQGHLAHLRITDMAPPHSELAIIRKRGRSPSPAAKLAADHIKTSLAGSQSYRPSASGAK
jgi:DNA-binding transcriptional LysR family regulator